MNNLGKALILVMAGIGTAVSAPASAAPPHSPGAAAPGEPVSRTEVKQFAAAAIGIHNIQQDTTKSKAQKQRRMIAMLQKQGLTPKRFEEIAKASRVDQKLKSRIQSQITAQEASGR